METMRRINGLKELCWINSSLATLCLHSFLKEVFPNYGVAQKLYENIPQYLDLLYYLSSLSYAVHSFSL